MNMLEVTDVKTKADVHTIFAQKCMFNGYNVSIAVLIFGAATIPYGFTRINFLNRLEKEYKIFAGLAVTVGASLFSGVYFKNACERRIVKQLRELKLDHLVEGIEV